MTWPETESRDVSVTFALTDDFECYSVEAELSEPDFVDVAGGR